jgi:hypothetical protein
MVSDRCYRIDSGWSTPEAVYRRYAPSSSVESSGSTVSEM